MTLEQMIKILKQYQHITHGAPNAMTEAQLRQRANDPEFTRRRQLGEAYMTELNKKTQLDSALSKKYSIKGNLNRFPVFYMRTDDTPEAAELNEDLYTMLYCPEGKQLLADMAIRTMLNQDFSMCYPENLQEAFDLTVNKPFAAEQMFISSLMLGAKQPFTLDPLVQEQLENAKLTLESTGLSTEAVAFYGGDRSLLLTEELSVEGSMMIRGNIQRAKGTPNAVSPQFEISMNQFGDNVMRYVVDNPEARRETIRNLKRQGVIGPDSMYYRAFDEHNKRISMDKAITALSEGKKVEFKKMSPEEQKKLREALKNPTTVEKVKVGPTAGQPLKDLCIEMYHQLVEADNALIPSSPQYRKLKKVLKGIAESKTIPNQEQAKKLLREVVSQTSVYVDTKEQDKNLSEYGQKRLKIVSNIHKVMSVKLGSLALADYRAKAVAREIHEENQARMTEAMEARERLEAAIKAPPVVRNIVVDEKDKGTYFDNLVSLANYSMRRSAEAIKPNGKVDADFTNGRYLAVMLAYNLIVAERNKNAQIEAQNKALGNADPKKLQAPDHTLEALMNSVGSKAFYKGVQNCAPIQAIIKGGITPEKIRTAVANGLGPKLVNELRKDENIKQITAGAQKYALDHDHASKVNKALPTL